MKMMSILLKDIYKTYADIVKKTWLQMLDNLEKEEYFSDEKVNVYLDNEDSNSNESEIEREN